MSVKSTTVTERHFEYIATHTSAEDEFLHRLKAAAVAEGIPQIWISPEQAAFMQVLLRLVGAREVVEVGTLAGYSAIVMARALPSGGRVRTIEIDSRHFEFARRWAAKSDVADRVEVIFGTGLDILPTLAADSADAAFLDADKISYPQYLEQSLRIVRRGGLIMVDNAFAFGQLFDENPADREAPAVKLFNEIMAREQRLQTIIVPIGDGLWVGVKR
jgi:caffeoyl-CoA O-methyltransferase